MPQIGWEIDGERWSLEEALQIARTEGAWQGYPAPVLQRLVATERDEDVISPSMAAGCLRQAFLRREVDYYADPRERFAAGIGTAVHEWLAGSEDSDRIIKETRFEIPVAGNPLLKLSGQIDRFDIEHGILIDFKTTNSLYKKDPPPYDYVLQQNLYIYLLRRHGYEVKRSFLWFVVPKTKRKKVEEGFITEVDRMLVEVPIWPPDEQWAAVDALAERIRAILRTGELPPPYAPDDENAWRCQFCPVAEICAQRALDEMDAVA